MFADEAPSAEAEAEMLARIKAGDKAACDVCIETHTPTLYRLALRILGDEAEAQDAVQETFINAFKAIGKFDGRSRLATWLYRIAHNQALMKLRSRRETASLDESEDNEESRPELAVWDESPDALTLEHETTRVIGDAVNALPDTLRNVFILREIEDMSTAQAAQKLGVSEAALKVRLHRARAALRKNLSAYFAERAMPADQLESLACGEALKFIEHAEQRGEKVDESLKESLREFVAQCERCRLLLDPGHKSILFYCDDRESAVPERVRKKLYARLRNIVEN
ncbi:MAG TPA: sigma-70 family RNA polymerase sigma factor [Thermoflexales bacterium]|nr:sigma-70 family RNA polymerase sigma factor [Thermoflexales bacterium]HQW35934.1 sigma-70 family RNA polymerase sigma factor [Thermoflexales bacterium]HQZ22070.1 sigma-70 family RNA polymerase sigma factor [Thermoflexales bacterium]HQZ99990.1 sigma-70 family RNA polymerase sigma factor [Thermoflexales bacterium]